MIWRFALAEKEMNKWSPTMKTKKAIGYSIQHVYLFVQLAEAVERYKAIIAKDKKAEAMKGGQKAFLMQKYQYLREGERYNINILSCALIEALINTWLSLKTTDEQFKILERAKIKEKWVSIPTIFNKKYKLDKGSRLYQCLDSIIDMRNFIAHMKPTIIGVNKTLRAGNYGEKHSKEKLRPEEYFNTPVQLWIQLYDQEKDAQVAGVMGTFKMYFDLYKRLIRKKFEYQAG